MVAEAGGTLLGTVTVTDLGQARAYLGMLGVSPLAQANGIGRALLAAAEAAAVARFSVRWMEMTVIGLRRELVAWYQRRGYRLTGERRPFPEDVPGRERLEMVVLERPLS